MNYFVKNRIPSLDGLRTISVLFVVTSHFLYTIGLPDSWNLGILGVRFFFVISGFLITGLLLKEFEKTAKISLKRFYFRRTLRIFPPYYFYLLMILVGSKLGIFSLANEQFIAPLTYTSNYFASDSWNLLHTWSLSVEEQFYLIFPFLLVVMNRRNLTIFLLLVIVACPFLRLIDFNLFAEYGKMWIYYGFHANADSLAMGCLFAIFYSKLHQSVSYLKLINSPIVFVFPVALVLVNSIIDPRMIYLGAVFSMNNFLIVLCLDAAITNYQSTFGKFLNSKPMTKIGMMSYSIYLWQQPFLNHDSPQWFNLFPYNFFGIAIFSLFSYFVVEKTSLRYRQTIEHKWFKRSS